MVWINYGNLIKEMPLLGLNSKGAVANRIKKLKELELIQTEQTENGRLYASTTPKYEAIAEYRDKPVKPQTVHDGERGVHQNERGVHDCEQGPVHNGEHIDPTTISHPKTKTTAPRVGVNGNKSKGWTFRSYHDDCKAKGIKLIPENHGVFKYAQKMHIDLEMIYAAWYEFKYDHLERDDKKQKDWPKVFLVYVRKNYLRIWNVDQAGNFTWSNKGHQTRKAMKGDVEGDL
jgi:hypothetical protein